MDAAQVKKRLVMLAVGFWFVGFLTGPRSAAQDDLLALNTPVSGSVAAGSQQIWTLPLREGGIVSLLVNAEDDLDPVVTIQTASGDTLIRNDDYDPETSRDALIEAFTPPRTGTYQVVVSGYGDTGGDYTLTAIEGYGQIDLIETFDDAVGWETEVSEGGSVFENAAGGFYTLESGGIGVQAWAENDSLTAADWYYASVLIVEAQGRNGWHAGIGFSVRDDTYFDVSVDQRGTWRLARIGPNGTETLRDWTSHPAIVPGSVPFTLGIWVKGDTLSVFYDRQLVGSTAQPGLSASGGLAVTSGTPNMAGSTSTVTFDNLTVTTPLTASAERFPDQIINTSPTTIVRELQRRTVVAGDGAMVLNIPETTARNVEAGISRFPLARGEIYTDFIFGATVSWTSASGIHGCGLVVHDASSEDTYGLVYVDSSGSAGIATRIDDTFPDAVFRDDLTLNSSPYDLVIVAHEGALFAYVDGQYIGAVRSATETGGIGQAVVNFDPGDTNCRFNDVWLWRW